MSSQRGCDWPFKMWTSFKAAAVSSRFNQRQQIAQKKPQEGDRHQEPRGQSAAARNVAQKTDQTDAVCVSGTNNNENQIRPEGFESCLWTCPAVPLQFT